VDQRIKSIMGEILEVDPAAITETFGPPDAVTWDSLNALRLVTALEEAFAIQLEMREIPEMTSFAAIRSTIARHLGQPEGAATQM